VIGSSGVETLKRQRPEWSPWLAVVDAVLREASDPRWEAAVPDVPAARGRSLPLLSGATVSVDEGSVRRLLRRLVDLASGAGTPKMATLRASLRRETDTAGLFRAAIRQDYEFVERLAADCSADAEALQGIVALVGIPFLQACNRRWAAAIPRDWVHGYCPVCASWPAFAEMRGIERSRHFRCGRCGAEWHAQILHCAYCDNILHDDLVTLVPGKAGSSGAVEACRRCHGYVKVFTRLQGCPPPSVILEDLGSVDLDVAALDQGYTRASGPGSALDVAVTIAAGARGFFAWNA
jgi:FdhE protein